MIEVGCLYSRRSTHVAEYLEAHLDARRTNADSGAAAMLCSITDRTRPPRVDKHSAVQVPASRKSLFSVDSVDPIEFQISHGDTDGAATSKAGVSEDRSDGTIGCCSKDDGVDVSPLDRGFSCAMSTLFI